MHNSFKDVTDKLGEPKWYDVRGYPRYCDFAPSEVSNIYAKIVFLVKIACQACHEEFNVAVNFDEYSLWNIKWIQEMFSEIAKTNGIENFTLKDCLIPFLDGLSKDGWYDLLHYGDPPHHGCVGDTMNVYDLRVVECWIRDVHSDWVRFPKYEIEIESIEEDSPDI